jgi:hypothetical protein
MSSTRPNLFILFLRSLTAPIALFAIWSAIDRANGSHRWVLLATIAGLFILPILGAFIVRAARALLRRYFRHIPETEFGITPPICPHCRYDLRASPDHCPECGHSVDPIDRTIIQYLTRLRRKP